MKCCINGKNSIRLLRLLIKLFKFEIEKCGQILCVHKPCFLMPGHILFFPEFVKNLTYYVQTFIEVHLW